MKKYLISFLLVLLAATAFAAPPAFVFKTDPALLLPTGCTNGQTATYTAATNRWACATASGSGDFLADGSVPMTGPLDLSTAGAVATVGEIGYASNVFSWMAGATSEKLQLTAGANLWTFSSDTAATFAFTPSVGFTAGAVLGPAGNAISVSSGGVATFAGTATLTSPPITTAITPISVGGATLGTAALEWGNGYFTDGAVIYGQADQSATLTSAASLWTANNFAVDTQFKIPSSNADPTATAGYMRHDSTVANHAHGALVWHDGTNIRQVVDMVTATASACTDDQVVAYDADNDLFYCKDDATAGTPTVITVADEAADASSFPLFVTAATGDLGPKTDTAFTYDPTSGTLGVTALTAGSITASPSADPTITLKDSDNAAGTGKIFANSSGGANDIILSIGVEDSTGESTVYIEVDGVTETIDLIKPVVTTSTVQVGTNIELGHASDTTLSRSAAGVLQVEGATAVLIGQTLVTRTEFIPVGWMIDGAAAPAALATTDLGTRQVKTRAFQADTADQDLEMFWQAPNEIVDGDAAAGFQVKWRPIFVITSATAPAAGEGVAFALQSCSSGNGDTGDCTVGTASVIADADLDAHVQFDIVYGGWTEMTVTDGAASEGWFMKLYRDQDNAIDDYVQPVGLVGIELKYQTKPLNDY